jgi:hypothetical protein
MLPEYLNFLLIVYIFLRLINKNYEEKMRKATFYEIKPLLLSLSDKE